MNIRFVTAMLSRMLMDRSESHSQSSQGSTKFIVCWTFDWLAALIKTVTLDKKVQSNAITTKSLFES